MEKNALILRSSAPLPNEMLKIKKLYWICVALLLIGVFVQAFLAFALLGFIVVYIIDYLGVSAKQGHLRTIKFKYDSEISQDELMEKLQPALLSQYGNSMIFERDEKGMISISFKNHIYDIHLSGDNTMTIWWRKSLSGAFFSVNNYKSYKQNLNSMGIIAYEIQKCCGIN